MPHERIRVVGVRDADADCSLVNVPLGVLAQVIGPGERLVAHAAHEALLTRVGAGMSSQLIGPVEGLGAARPLAGKGQDVLVRGFVGPEVTGLGVLLPAPGEVAHVLGGLGAGGRVQAVGTVAGLRLGRTGPLGRGGRHFQVPRGHAELGQRQQ